MKEPDWARGWELLEEFKASLDPARYALYKPTIDAMAALLNKQDPAGYTLVREFLLQDSVIKFYSKYMDKLYEYRDWIAAFVEPEGEHFKDVDAAYRKAFEKHYDIA